MQTILKIYGELNIFNEHNKFEDFIKLSDVNVQTKHKIGKFIPNIWFKKKYKCDHSLILSDYYHIIVISNYIIITPYYRLHSINYTKPHLGYYKISDIIILYKNSLFIPTGTDYIEFEYKQNNFENEFKHIKDIIKHDGFKQMKDIIKYECVDNRTIFNPIYSIKTLEKNFSSELHKLLLKNTICVKIYGNKQVYICDSSDSSFLTDIHKYKPMCHTKNLSINDILHDKSI